MATQLKPVDILLVGYGWTGGIIAKELASTGLKILALERGGPRDTNPDFLEPRKDDELRYAVRHELMQDVSRETLTFRNKSSQTALPMRQLGSFLPGDGVGGAGVHWNGVTWRWTPWDQEARKQTVERYGEKIIPEGMNLQDWGISYDELEPYYDKFEKTCGVSGKAGNLNGRKIDGGNVFEGPRKSEYPNPPLKQSQTGLMFEKAARNLGYHPFPSPAANSSQPYTNPDGVAFGQCHYCGFCERFGCEANAKASPHFTVMPIAARNPNFELRTHANVMKVLLDSTGRKATGVVYVDARGREFIQPADLVVLSAYALGNVALMLWSGIGKPYDPVTNTGVIGRNYAYQASSGATLFFDEKTYINSFMGAGALGVGLTALLEATWSMISTPATTISPRPAISAAAASAPRRRAGDPSSRAPCPPARRAGALNGRRRPRPIICTRPASPIRAPTWPTAATISISIPPIEMFTVDR